MKQRWLWSVGIVCALMLIGMGSAAYGDIVVSTGTHINAFRDDLADKTDGTEVTVPFGVSYRRGGLFALNLETAYSSATVKSGGGTETDISGFTDTLLSASYSLSGESVLLTLGVDVNLPTGKENLNEDEDEALSGEEDLLTVSGFGEGGNVGLSVSAIKQLGNVTLGANGLYVYKGEYDQTSDVEDDDVDPGDQLLLAWILNWKASEQSLVELSGAYSYSGADAVNGEEDFQEGGIVTLGGSFQHTSDPFTITVSLQEMLQLSDKELIEDELATEDQNSNSHTLSLACNVNYSASERLRLQALGDVWYTGESERKTEADGVLYTGKRVRYSFGSGVGYTIRENFWGHGLVKYLVINEKPDLAVEEERTLHGVDLNIGVTYRF